MKAAPQSGSPAAAKPLVVHSQPAAPATNPIPARRRKSERACSATIRAVSIESAPPAARAPVAAVPALAGPAPSLPSAASAMAAIPLTTDPAAAQPFAVMAVPVAVVQLPAPAAMLPPAVPSAPAAAAPVVFPATTSLAAPAPVTVAAPALPAAPTAVAAPTPTALSSGTNAVPATKAPAGPTRIAEWQARCGVACDRACDCCDRTCDWCDRTCCRAYDCAFDNYDQFVGQGGQFTANVGFMILSPKWGNNPAFNAAAFQGPLVRSQSTDLDYGTQIAPRVSLGFVSGSGLGARVGWWGFGIGNGQTSPTGAPAVSAAPLGLQADTLGAGASTFLATGGHLQFNVWDFEGTQYWQCGCWSLLGTAGLRYAHIGQSYIASVYGPSGANLQNLSSGHNFDGVGPTVSLGGKRRLGKTPLYFYGTGRGSMLFGNSNASATLTGPAVSDPADAHSSSDAIVPVAEVELGFGYYQSVYQRARMFAEAGVIGQSWFNTGNSSGSLAPPGSPFNSSFAPNCGTLGLIGLSVRCGVNF